MSMNLFTWKNILLYNLLLYTIYTLSYTRINYPCDKSVKRRPAAVCTGHLPLPVPLNATSIL